MKHTLIASLLAAVAIFLTGCALGPQKQPRALINALFDTALPSDFNGPVHASFFKPVSAKIDAEGVHRLPDGTWTFTWLSAALYDSAGANSIELGTKPTALPTLPMAPTSSTTSTPATIQQTTTVIPAAK